LLMLKLILQPIIENAVYHGIKEREGKGRIIVKGFRHAGFIFFEIADNGVGMERERIDKILKGELRGKKSGFGIYSLIQRVSLYYCLNDPVSIESKTGEGTVVKVKLKVIGENGTENLFRIDR
ncbi:MAG: sensor histidine kinase, partial [Treponema maltophilum]